MIFASKYEGMGRMGNFGEDSRKSLNELLRIYCVELMIYLLTAIGLSPGGSSTVHIYTQKIHRTI